MDHDLNLLLEEFTVALAGLSAREIQAAPAASPEKWCIQEIVEHMHLTYVSTVQVLENRIKKGHPTLTKPALGQRMWKVLILRFGYFPHGRKAPAQVTPSLPSTVRSGDEMLRQVESCLTQIDELTLRGEKIFGNQAAASHGVLGPLTMAEWRRFHLVHGRHHMKQIRVIRQSRES